jgi:glutamyl-tRNA synthetase
MSKRHGALGVQEYRALGYLPQALRNYLLRLGWSHGDAEIISTAQAVEWFDLGSVGRAAARFDFAKLDSLNGHYIRETPDGKLADLVWPFIQPPPDKAKRDVLLKAMPGLKTRAKTLVELAANARFYVASRPVPLDKDAQKILDAPAKARIAALLPSLEGIGETNWIATQLESLVKQAAESQQAKLGELAQPLRAALTGSKVSPGIFEVMEALGRVESLGRLADALTPAKS